MTQFGSVLYDLAIKLICANSSESKGRVEHANQTLQDRLIKEMRLEGITGITLAFHFGHRSLEFVVTVHQQSSQLRAVKFCPADIFPVIAGDFVPPLQNELLQHLFCQIGELILR
ncbi:hypothetical protein VL10_12980 [Leclercia adecarboxylata]|nr:hypothetical protein VL10_12980 [Leclercia adecarboxylata]KMN66809.1 hypothetical protein VK95_04215 [Leclercia sp. LK8]